MGAKVMLFPEEIYRFEKIIIVLGIAGRDFEQFEELAYGSDCAYRKVKGLLQQFKTRVSEVAAIAPLRRPYDVYMNYIDQALNLRSSAIPKQQLKTAKTTNCYSPIGWKPHWSIALTH